MRLFFAVNLPPDILKCVERVQEELQAQIGHDGIRWTRPGQFHYTLKFLGEQSFDRANKAVELATAIAEEALPFRLTLETVGAFPNSQRPSVVWMGASQGAEDLAALAARIDEVLSRRGFAREKKPVKAHLTLARIKTYTGEEAAARLVRSAPSLTCGTFEVNRFALMRSILKPEGSEYSLLQDFELSQP